MKKKSTKIFNLFMNIFTYVFLAISLMMLVLTITSKKDIDGATSIFGYQIRIVVSESMARSNKTFNTIKKYPIKSIPVKSVVLIKTIPNKEEKKDKFIDNIKIGDVLTFKYVIGSKQEIITHRVINLTDQKDGLFVELKGDNVSDNSLINTTSQIIDVGDENSPNYIIGKVVAKSHLLGIVLYSLKQPLGMALLIIIPSIIIMVVEIIKITSYIYSIKKKKAENELTSKELELQELKLKLQKLEKSEEGGKSV